MNFGAIDIGSNAARVLISRVDQRDGKTHYNKLKLLRYPLRLGIDAFSMGKISAVRADKMILMCRIFKQLMELYDVEDYLAYATSAMRTAQNGQELRSRIEEEAGISLEIINGQQEAGLLYETHFIEQINPNRNYIYVDVGGGSTEVALMKKNKELISHSFQLGTIRLLQGQVGQKEFDYMNQWVKSQVEDEEYWGIGAGGNINTVFSTTGKKKSDFISLDYLNEFKQSIENMSQYELMEDYGFKEDRAEVIKPALNIYLNAFEAAQVNGIYVPMIGLVDGMIIKISKQYE